MPSRLHPQINRTPITTAEATANQATRIFDLDDHFLTNVIAQTEDVAKYDIVIHPKSLNLADGITLAQHAKQRAANKDVIWEGKEWLPKGWRLSVVCIGTLTVGDNLVVRAGYVPAE